MSEDVENKKIIQRPFFLSILCVIVFVYSTLFILLFLSGGIFNNWITTVLNDFLNDDLYEKQFILTLSVSGLVLYSLSFISALLIWRLKRIGFYLYSLSSLALIIIPFFFNLGSWISSGILILMILSFAIYFRKLA